MINEENFTYYLRYLVKLSDTQPFSYNKIPKPFYEYFTIAALSQALNIHITPVHLANYSAVEDYLNGRTFSDLSSLCQGIRENFTTDIDRLYAAYYYTTHNVEYDISLLSSRSLIDPTIKSVFTNKKGICGDYSRLFIRIAKRSGVNTSQVKIDFFINISKASKYSPFFPPTDKKSIEANLHACLLIKFGDLLFMSEPTWGSGGTREGKFVFDYKKPYFLVPYYTAILRHYPYQDFMMHRTFPLSWNQYVSLNRISVVREVSLESNPFQVIYPKNGFYELQFSFVQFSEDPQFSFYLLKGSQWIPQNPLFACLTCLDKKVPSHYFTYFPDKLRSRYKLTVIFSKEGSWKVLVKDDRLLFDVYFVVDGFDRKLHSIPTLCNSEKSGFYPVKPVDVLTTVNDGFARIRFAISNKKSSSLVIETYQIKTSFIGYERKEKVDCNSVSFSAEIFDSNEIDLVEKWILVQFPSEGLWEVCLRSKDELDPFGRLFFKFFATYYFDVKNCATEKISPLFDFPKSRKFSNVSFDNFSILPPLSSVVMKKSSEFHFHVLSQNEIVDKIVDAKDEIISPKLVSEKETENSDVIDREYCVSFPDCGNYKLKLNGYDDEIQNYFVVDSELVDESEQEKDLMENLKKKIEEEFDYNADIPEVVKMQVDKMLMNPTSDKDVVSQSACCLLI